MKRYLFPVALALMTSAPQACASDTETAAVTCDGGRSFLLRITPQGALVTLDRRTFMLSPRTSSLGLRFEGAGAAVIIDQDHVALVLADDADFHNCHLDGVATLAARSAEG